MAAGKGLLVSSHKACVKASEGIARRGVKKTWRGQGAGRAKDAERNAPSPPHPCIWPPPGSPEGPTVPPPLTLPWAFHPGTPAGLLTTWAPDRGGFSRASSSLESVSGGQRGAVKGPWIWGVGQTRGPILLLPCPLPPRPGLSPLGSLVRSSAALCGAVTPGGN